MLPNKKPGLLARLWKLRLISNLLPGNVISLFGAHLVLLAVRQDLDRTKQAIGLKVFRFIKHRILAAQLFVDIVESVGYILQFEREERLPVVSASIFRLRSPASI